MSICSARGMSGKALARALAALPLQVHVIDTRPDELHDLPRRCRRARGADAGGGGARRRRRAARFVILTHDHALDFLIAAEALKRADAPYVGMVGSRDQAGEVRELVSRRGRDASATAATCPADRRVRARG